MDAAVVLGSSHSVYDREAVGSWIDGELAWFRDLAAAGVPTLGVCFGAQAMAAAFGGSVERAPRPEIGWVDVDTELPELAGPWLEYHEDRCVVPAGAAVLATNDAGVQAWRVDRSWAVQWHPEVDGAQLQRWFDHGGVDAVERAGVDPAAWLARTVAEEPAAAERAAALVGLFLRS